MLLTITYKGENAADLGFLLHKNPSRPQEVSLSYGKAIIFYPVVEKDICTAALLLDINPLDLTRGKTGSRHGGLYDYINDRPYVSSSFMSSAIARVFGTAMTGRSDTRQELSDQALDLSATITMLPFQGELEMLEKVFSPLGYTVDFKTIDDIEGNQEWAGRQYVDLTISGMVRLRDLLRELYVLIPVFDHQKHYWMNKEEVDKLLHRGEGWLENHPEKEFITRRYFRYKRSLTRLALERLDNGEAGSLEESDDTEKTPVEPNLNAQRLTAVVDTLEKSGATSVIDMGCGEGNLLRLLMKDRTFTRIAGTDVSISALERAHRKLRMDTLPELQRKRITLFHSSLTYKDDRYAGYDAAAVVEVIEHLGQNRLRAFAQVLFGAAKPAVVVLTTPNIEYNKNYEGLADGHLRHSDHRFEWSREQFQTWSKQIAENYGYTVAFEDIGELDEEAGAPTQMGVFTICR